MRQALADALASFDGALLVISHDRTMLRSVVDSLWLVADGGLTPFDDDLDGYARWLASRRNVQISDSNTNATSTQGQIQNGAGTATGESAPSSIDRRERKRSEATRRAKLAPLTKAVSRQEKLLDKAISGLTELRGRLAADGLYDESQKSLLAQLLADEATARRDVEEIEEQLLASMEALEEATTENGN